MAKKLTCDSPIAQFYVDKYWASEMSVAELADNIVDFCYHETVWVNNRCSFCGAKAETETRYCPNCGAKAVQP